MNDETDYIYFHAATAGHMQNYLRLLLASFRFRLILIRFRAFDNFELTAKTTMLYKYNIFISAVVTGYSIDLRELNISAVR